MEMFAYDDIKRGQLLVLQTVQQKCFQGGGQNKEEAMKNKRIETSTREDHYKSRHVCSERTTLEFHVMATRLASGGI